MKVYLSASFAMRKKLGPFVEAIERRGHSCTSSWIGEPPIEFADPTYLDWHKRARANDDVTDVERADTLIMVTNVPSTTGGRSYELARASAAGKRIIVVGPPDNIFFHRAEVEYAIDFEDALDKLEE